MKSTKRYKSICSDYPLNENFRSNVVSYLTSNLKKKNLKSWIALHDKSYYYWRKFIQCHKFLLQAIPTSAISDSRTDPPNRSKWHDQWKKGTLQQTTRKVTRLYGLCNDAYSKNIQIYGCFRRILCHPLAIQSNLSHHCWFWTKLWKGYTKTQAPELICSNHVTSNSCTVITR